jgi:hypothetical protein
MAKGRRGWTKSLCVIRLVRLNQVAPIMRPARYLGNNLEFRRWRKKIANSGARLLEERQHEYTTSFGRYSDNQRNSKRKYFDPG